MGEDAKLCIFLVSTPAFVFPLLISIPSMLCFIRTKLPYFFLINSLRMSYLVF